MLKARRRAGFACGGARHAAKSTGLELSTRKPPRLAHRMKICCARAPLALTLPLPCPLQAARALPELRALTYDA